jgi:hypothetical protein
MNTGDGLNITWSLVNATGIISDSYLLASLNIRQFLSVSLQLRHARILIKSKALMSPQRMKDRRYISMEPDKKTMVTLIN